MPLNSIRYETARQWPILFPDVESLQTFWRVLEDYAASVPENEGSDYTGPPVPTIVTANVDGHVFTTLEELLGHPSRSMTSLTLNCSGPSLRGVNIALHIKKSSTEITRFAPKGGFVFIQGLDQFTQDPSVKRFQSVLDSLEYTTRPATLKERLSSAPIVTKFTEAEYYAETRAAKVRWQSLGLGIVGGVLTTAVAAWMNLN